MSPRVPAREGQQVDPLQLRPDAHTVAPDLSEADVLMRRGRDGRTLLPSTSRTPARQMLLAVLLSAVTIPLGDAAHKQLLHHRSRR